MNPDSLDSSIQSSLSALYPPFEATAPAVFSQLLHVTEGRYGGDSLQCLTDFLIPARRLLERVRQATCDPYSDLAIGCPGWPLCLYDNIVVHLAPINPLLLSFEDFYLQVVPFEKQAARIVVRSLLEEEREGGQDDLEETPIPENSFSRIFTEDWLEELNLGRHGRLLSHCVLASEHCIVKVPWDQVVYPEFEDQPQYMDPSDQPEPSWQGYSVETRICPAKDGIAVSLCLVDSSRQSEINPAMSGVRPLGWVSPNTWDSRSIDVDEGVHDVEPRQLKGDFGDSPTAVQPKTCLLRANRVTAPGGLDHTAHDRPTCGRTVRFAEQPCTPCLRRKHGQGTKNQECRYKEYCREDQCSLRTESRPRENVPSGRTARTDHLYKKQFTQSTSHNSNPDHSQGVFDDATEQSSAMAKRVSENQSLTAVQGYETGMPTRLHVAHGKKTTTYGLVSPKLNRRKPQVPEEAQDHKNVLAEGPYTNKTVTVHYPEAKKPGKRSPFPNPTKSETCLLQAGLSCLTGGRDRWNRAVVEVYGDHQHWASPLLSSLVLSKLLLYFHTIVSREEREYGMTLVYDGRKVAPHPEFFEALEMLQEQQPKAIHCVLLLISKEKSYSPKKCPGYTDVVTSFKALNRYIEYSQLSPGLEGTLLYSHRNWLHLHQELYPFVSALTEATCSVLQAVRTLEGVHKIDTAQDVQQCINDQRVLMNNVLEDTQLVLLQREGGPLLARLRWESDVRAAHFETSWVMDTIESLYNKLEEHVHVLVRRSNVLFQHLGFLLHLRQMESRLAEIKEWFQVEGERRILEAECAQEPNRSLEEIVHCLSAVLAEANEHKLQAMMLLNEAEGIQGPNCPETEVFNVMISAFKSNLSEFLSEAERYCDELEIMLNVCHFCERATVVAIDCSQQIEEERLQCLNHQEKWAALQGCHEKLSRFSPEHFQEAKSQACSLQNPWGRKVWNMTWLRCQEVSRQLEDTLQELEQEQHSSLPTSSQYEWHGHAGQESDDGGARLPPPATQVQNPPRSQQVQQNRDSIHGTVTCFNISFRQSRKGRKGVKMAPVADPEKKPPRKPDHDNKQIRPVAGSDTVGCQWFSWHHNATKSTKEDSSTASSSSKIQILPSTFTESTTTPPNSQSSGLTYSGTPTSGVQNPIPRPINFSPESEARRPENPPRLGSEAENTRNSPDMESRTMKLQCILEELLVTELEYVRSLAYTLTHYLPLLAQPDVPPDLRGQRGRIFGNLEKLYDFHCHYFLQELEDCRTEPCRVGGCFLRHKENFGLYALYSKNKPQSDALIQQHKFFKRKQLELGDSMDLSSYLLKPVQRISKYSLLLQEMLEECGASQEAERLEIQGAAEVVRFQLRHGNDLLTMDAIRDCDVNLQEQGQLMRQDELYVTFRKKRSLRRVFLFQDLILFTKTKKTHRGDDVYVYKQSFKTCDIGLTRNCGQSGLCFEIWFRRRRAQDTYTLQAERQDLKEAWTADLERILWEQAMKNRELRRQEQVFMGMGVKPFMKLQPKEGGVHDRTLTCFLQDGEIEELKSQNPVASRLQSDTPLPRPESIGSTSGSQSSSSSGRGSLSPSGFRESQAHETSNGKQIPPISHPNINQVSSTEAPGRYGSRLCGAPGSCSAPGGRITPPAGRQHTSPALSRKKGLGGSPRKTHTSYEAKC